jgi:hypothetical protein
MVQRSRPRYGVASAAVQGVGSLPKPIYEALPLVYLGLAVLLLVMVETPVIFLSSALFGAAGVGVLWMRFRHRRG